MISHVFTRDSPHKNMRIFNTVVTAVIDYTRTINRFYFELHERIVLLYIVSAPPIFGKMKNKVTNFYESSAHFAVSIQDG